MEEEKKIEEKKHKKSKEWLFFALGLVVGFVLSISIFLMDRYFSKGPLRVTRTFENIYRPGSVRPDTVHISVPVITEREDVSRVEEPAAIAVNIDSLFVADEYFAQWEDAEFTIEPEDTQDVVVLDQLINNRKIKVQVKPSQKDTMPVKTAPIAFFEVQQWSTPIRNSLTHQFSNKVIRIKGMDISNIEIFYCHGKYYVFNGTHYYLLNNTTPNFERLVVSELPTE